MSTSRGGDELWLFEGGSGLSGSKSLIEGLRRLGRTHLLGLELDESLV
jgi:hypothetical protein